MVFGYRSADTKTIPSVIRITVIGVFSSMNPLADLTSTMRPPKSAFPIIDIGCDETCSGTYSGQTDTWKHIDFGYEKNNANNKQNADDQYFHIIGV